MNYLGGQFAFILIAMQYDVVQSKKGSKSIE